MKAGGVMRVARPTDNLGAIAEMTFEDLDGYRVVLQNSAWTA